MALKLLKKRLDAQGNEILIKGGMVIADVTTGATVEDLYTEARSFVKQADVDAAITAIKDGVPSDADTLNKLHTSLEALKTTIGSFFSGDADDNAEDLNRLQELITAIHANKTSIDALVSDHLTAADIIDGLSSEATDKALSAAQGKALKTLIDAVDAKVTAQHAFANQTVLDAITTDDNGNLKYNEHVLDGATSVAFVATEGATPTFDGKIVMVVEPYDGGSKVTD